MTRPETRHGGPTSPRALPLPRPAATPPTPSGLTELADGVHLFVRPGPDGRPDCTGLVVGPEGVTVIGALPSARERAVAGAVAALGAGPVRLVLATHTCGAPPTGRGAFPEALTVAHAGARAEAEPGPPAALPALTFEDRLTVHSGRRRIELLSCGPAHTRHDVVAWLPADGILFAGGVLSAGTVPVCARDGSVEGMRRAVRTLRTLGAGTVVCGHGPLAGTEAFDLTERQLRRVQALAMDGWSRDLTPEQAARQAGPATGPVLLGNLRRAYAELDGEPLGCPVPLREAVGEAARGPVRVAPDPWDDWGLPLGGGGPAAQP
ncbi:MBL fold metallo-hydrolase [Kitasatospora sp. NPDC096147]|uniref:MBL fold metallo-hydrolase n=1 Tax=Kitasatospora sp. NPDC096147 TaxID=3364093 RepID=UPI00380B8D07